MPKRIYHPPNPTSQRMPSKSSTSNAPDLDKDDQMHQRQRSRRGLRLDHPSSRTSFESLSEDASLKTQYLSEMSSKIGRPSSSAGSSDDDQTVRYTKTGRVSKALKGQPVHKCDICNKYYTRAEHLRRHQLNHKGARPWLCDVPGCDKSLPNRGFYREDLLLRHMEDHKSGPHDLTGLGINDRAHSPSCFSENPTVHLISPISGGDMFSHSSLSEASYPGCVGPTYSPLLSNCLDTPGLYESPPPEQVSSYQPYFLAPGFTGGDSWPSQAFDINRSVSPASAVSSFTSPGWPNTELRPPMHMLSLSDSDNSTYNTTESSYQDGHSQTSSEISTQGNSTADLDAFDLVRINQDAEGLLAALGEPQALATFVYLQELYLPLFWQKFSPAFPIIHRPTFDAAQNIPPLLKALMTAIGASYVNTPGARIVARTLRDTCVKLAEKKQLDTLRTGRVWDLHIVFLLEVFLLYRSRRPSIHTSKRFELLRTSLQTEDALCPSKSCEDLAAIAFNPDDATAASIQTQWILNETKRRIYLACYVFDAKRSLLFQQQRNIPDEKLPFTCSSPLWEARDLQTWRELAQGQSYNPQQLEDVIYQQRSLPYDTFSAAIITAYGTSSQHLFQQFPPGLDSIGPHPRDSLSYHAMLMANCTPIRDLLAVSGETFVLGEKLTLSGEYEQAHMNLQMWVQSEDASKAIYHAIKVLNTAFENGRCGLLHEEWALYIASLISWACGMWMQQEQSPAYDRQRSRRQSPAQETEEQMATFLARFEAKAANDSPEQNLNFNDWTGTRSCLIWVQKRISGQLGGLVEDAVTVLDKLINNHIT